MPENKIFSQYLNNEYDKDEIFNSIYNKIRNKNIMKKRIVNLSAVMFSFIIIGISTSSIYAKKNWDKEYNEYLSRYVETANSSINIEKINGNMQNLDMDYLYQDGIGVKINSLIVNEYTCQMDIEFNILDESKKKYNAFEFGYAVYDDNNNIYIVHERSKYNNSKPLYYEKKLCQELGLKYNSSKSIPKKLIEEMKLNPISINNENITMRLELVGKETLPKSKKIYIRIFDIGYSLANFTHITETELKLLDSENFTLSNAEWQFEIQIPEEFYERNYIELKIEKDIEEFNVEKVLLSNTNLTVIANTELSYSDIIYGVYISDENENTYLAYKISNLINNKELKLIYNVGRANLNTKLYLNINIPKYNINEKIELTK